MGAHHHAEPFPTGPLVGAGILIAFVIMASAVARGTAVPSMPETTGALQVRNLHFEDRYDGAVVVLDADLSREVDVVAPGTNGFLRATLRGLARDRKRQGTGPEVPFRLSHWPDGQTTLDDPVTGRRVVLDAFGTVNAHAFARLLEGKEGVL